jgi:adenosylcobyric acid synthase
MALNSAVTPLGHEIGRAQAAQAQACGVEPEAAMNPILLKPTSNRTSQVIVMGRPWAVLDAVAYQRAKADLWPIVLEQLAGLRRRYDVVVCEGAGSPAEINLLDGDIVNLRLAHAAGLAAIVVGDIDRGGVFASLYGTVALLPDELRSQVRAFVINKFRGDPALLRGGPEEIERLTGVPTLGVLPWLDGIGLDAEDSLALRAWPDAQVAGVGPADLDVAVVRFPRISNFTDLDALGLEPAVRMRLVDSPAALGRPDLLILPGTKATVADLGWLRATGLADEIARLAALDTTVLGICGGYQMLGTQIDDLVPVESPSPGVVDGLGLLKGQTTFTPEKVTRQVTGSALGHPVSGYLIHHGRTAAPDPWIETTAGPDGSVTADGSVFGTSVHGLFESDCFRQAFLGAVAERVAKPWGPSETSFAAARQDRFDRLADAVEANVDMGAIERLIAEAGALP